MLSLAPHRDITDNLTRTAEVCGRSAARALRARRIRCRSSAKGYVTRQCQIPGEITAFLYLGIGSFRTGMVDKNGSGPLYRSSWARRRLARWRVCEAPHCSHGDRACGHALVAMFVSLRRMCGVLCLRHSLGEGRRGFKVPGCLTGESEERETWTAGSLRAAFARRNLARKWPGRDFGGRRFRSTPGHLSGGHLSGHLSEVSRE